MVGALSAPKKSAAWHAPRRHPCIGSTSDGSAHLATAGPPAQPRRHQHEGGCGQVILQHARRRGGGARVRQPRLLPLLGTATPRQRRRPPFPGPPIRVDGFLGPCAAPSHSVRRKCRWQRRSTGAAAQVPSRRFLAAALWVHLPNRLSWRSAEGRVLEGWGQDFFMSGTSLLDAAGAVLTAAAACRAALRVFRSSSARKPPTSASSDSNCERMRGRAAPTTASACSCRLASLMAVTSRAGLPGKSRCRQSTPYCERATIGRWLRVTRG